ncbi:MAG: response regulator transcription factor [Gemmatimonadaceae bacterium]|nr:response regulator transcription factor [Gemmatimonadaceae bacterium]
MSETPAPAMRAVQHVLVVEDDPTMEAEAIAAVAVFPGASVRTARTVAEAERWIKRVRFDLAIIDLGLPDGSGVGLIRTLMGDPPHSADVNEIPTVCVARTVFDDDAHLFAVLSAGGQGYLLKGETIDVVRLRLQAAMAGEPVVSPSIARRVLAYFRGESPVMRHAPSRPSIPPAALTNRETDVLRQLAHGHTLAEVGKELSLSVNTVKTHVKNVYARLDVSSRIAAVDTARRMGILDDDARR